MPAVAGPHSRGQPRPRKIFWTKDRQRNHRSILAMKYFPLGEFSTQRELKPHAAAAHGTRAARPVVQRARRDKILRKHLRHSLSQNSQSPSSGRMPPVVSPCTAHSISRRGCKPPALYSTKIRWIHQPCKAYWSGMLHQGHSDGKGQMPEPPAQEGHVRAGAHFVALLSNSASPSI